MPGDAALFERDRLQERTSAGLARAKAQGKGWVVARSNSRQTPSGPLRAYGIDVTSC